MKLTELYKALEDTRSATDITFPRAYDRRATTRFQHPTVAETRRELANALRNMRERHAILNSQKF
jgi:hypothetical protein